MSDGRVRDDFDEIARLSGTRGGNRYDRFLVQLVPGHARAVLDVGCGLGRLAAALVASNRTVTGLDLSPEMIDRARRRGEAGGSLLFRCGSFLEMEFPPEGFDCVVSAAALHHMPMEAAVERMVGLVRPGGTLVIHDLRSDSGVLDRAGTAAAGWRTASNVSSGAAASSKNGRCGRHGRGMAQASVISR